MSNSKTIAAAVLTALIISTFVAAGPNPPALLKVVHGSTLQGSGTNPSPLDLALCGAGSSWVMNTGGTAWACSPNTAAYHDTTLTGSGTSSSDKLGLALCSAGSAYVMNGGGTAWGCSAVAPSNALTGVYHDTTLQGSGSSSSDKLGLALCGSNSVWVMNGSGTGWGCSAANSTGIGAGSITVTTATSGTPINLSTLGTIDWFAEFSVSAAGRLEGSRAQDCGGAASASVSCWEKILGGGLLRGAGIDWPGVCSATTQATAGLVTFTSTAGDTATGTALSSASVGTCAGATTGPVMRFVLPSEGNNIQRVARLYLYQYDSAMTCTATAFDGTATGSSASNSTGNGGVVNENVWTITYSTNTIAPVIVICSQTAGNTGPGTPVIGYGAASLGHV